MVGIKGLELRFRKIHPGRNPAPVHKSSEPTPQAQEEEVSPASTTTVQPEAPPTPSAPESNLEEIQIRAELSVQSSPPTPPAVNPAEATGAPSSRDDSCAPDSLGELGSFSRQFARTSPTKERSFDFVGSTTYTRAYSRAYELGGLRGTPSTIMPDRTFDLREQKRECSNEDCGMCTKGWSAEKTLFLAKTKLRREEENARQRRMDVARAIQEAEEEELRVQGRRDLEALERSIERGIEGEGEGWEDEDEISDVL